MQLRSGVERFSDDDLCVLSEVVSDAWASAADRDWSVLAGSLDWSCLATADHAVDCVYAPAFFLASRRTDAYPAAGGDLTLGARATPARLVESLANATRILGAVVRASDEHERAVIFRRPEVVVARPADFVPRGALELILHAHDVCAGLGVPFEPPADLCRRLREHTRRCGPSRGTVSARPTTPGATCWPARGDPVRPPDLVRSGGYRSSNGAA